VEFVIKHALQAFSPRNFQDNGKLFSYSADNCAAGIVSEKDRFEAPPFFDQSLGEPEEKWREVEIVRAGGFFFLIPPKFFRAPPIGNRAIAPTAKQWKIANRFALHSLDRLQASSSNC